jgi:hypothetical protein
MGLTNWWPADGNARDIWAGDNGTLENGATFAAGEVNQAFSLNGTNQYVDVGSVNLPTTFSIDAWVNPNDLSTRPIIIGKDDNASARSYAFEIESTGQLVGAVFSSAGLTLYETNSPVIVTGN